MRQIQFSGTKSWVVLAGLAITAAGIAAQMHKVDKPQQVVRAVGVYEWTGDLAKPKASRFVPVSVYIEGKFEDAGVYVARPMPFALQTGNVYELEDAGLAKGTVELSYARHVQATDAAGDSLFDDGWLGYGVYHAPPLTTVAKLRPSKTLPVITTTGGDSGRPHLSDKSDSGTKSESSSDDPGRPTMKRRTDSDSTASNSGDSTTSKTSESSSSKTSDDDADRPTLKRRSSEEMKKARKEKDLPSVSGGGLALNDDPDRPNLHRKQPGTNESGLSELRGIPADMHQMVAVSDAVNRELHVFARPWEDDSERAAVLAKMQAFARAQLAAYKSLPVPAVSVASAKSPGSAPAATSATESVSAAVATAEQDPGAPVLKRGIPVQPKTQAQTSTPAPRAEPATKTSTKMATRASKAKKTSAAPPTQTALLDEDLRGYTLSYGGAPTYVYTAHTDGTGYALRYVTIVAQDNGLGEGLGELKLALASVTDEAHLDRTPRLRLIDAVDAEASNRASLLFELRGQSSRQFALYRVIAAKPEQLFVTGSTE